PEEQEPVPIVELEVSHRLFPAATDLHVDLAVELRHHDHVVPQLPMLGEEGQPFLAFGCAMDGLIRVEHQTTLVDHHQRTRLTRHSSHGLTTDRTLDIAERSLGPAQLAM